MSEDQGLQTITLGGGCFWCLEAVYEQLAGVRRVESGYAGGTVPNPSYEQVCSGTTGHVEVVRVHFDPDVATLEDILDVFFAIHDPTTLNRQGPDEGTQYRSAIFYDSAQQREAAERAVRDLEAEGVFPAAIVTEIEPLTEFYVAEPYHQEYYRNNPNQPYCRVVIDPKVAKFRERYLDKLKKTSV